MSQPGLLTGDMVRTMHRDAIVFACANPTPEIFPDEPRPRARPSSAPAAARTAVKMDSTAFTVQTFEVTDAASHNRVSVTAEGDILVSGQQGLCDGSPPTVRSGIPIRASTDAVNCAALDTEGNVWLASSKKGA